MSWFSRPQVSSSNEDDDLPTAQQKEAFLTGYRLGCPVEGDAIPSEVNEDDTNYQRGLAAGQHDFSALPGSLKVNGKIRNK